MGRDEDSSDHDLSAFFYPALQAADVFELKWTLLGGMDQRKAHMYMREVQIGLTGKRLPVFIPDAFRLKGHGRMESFDHKMSKSDPENAILLDDGYDTIRQKMKKVFWKLEILNLRSLKLLSI